MSVESLYTHLLVKAGRDETYMGKPERLESYAIESGHNPLCGDSITWYIKTENSIVTDIRYEVKGCLISKASATFLCKLMDGSPVDAFSKYLTDLKENIQQDAKLPDKEELEQKNWLALTQIQAYPTRRKCVLLAWETLGRALDR